MGKRRFEYGSEEESNSSYDDVENNEPDDVGPVLGNDEDEKLQYLLRHDCSREKFSKYKAKGVNALREKLIELGSAVPFSVFFSGYPESFSFRLQIKPIDSYENGQFDDVCSLNDIDVNALLKYCEQSPFGDLLNKITRIDTSVRLAMECGADRLKVADKNEELYGIYGEKFLESAVASLKQHLLLVNSRRVDFEYGIELSLNKLNIYSKSGHFKPHTDTPTHDPALFIGTVVVCLPSEHKGGELVVRHCGKEQVFDFDQGRFGKIQFAAFYGDCEHEVLPVTSGHRVTLTYSILKTSTKQESYRRHRYDLVSKSADREMRPELPTEIFHAMVSTAQLNGGYVGIFLSHSYTNSGLQAANLKGVDEVVLSLLQERNVPVSLVPVLSSFYAEVTDERDYFHDYFELPYFKVNMADLEVDPRLDVHLNLPKTTPFLSAWDVENDLLKHRYKQARHMGNEMGDGYEERMYSKAAMIVGPFNFATAPVITSTNSDM